MSGVDIVVEERDGRRVARTTSPWEPVVGYSRAVRVGDVIAVTGTVGREEDGSVSPDIARQARRALEIVVAAIEALGGAREDIVRTRIFVTDIARWQSVGLVHGEVLGDVMPATSMVEVSRLIEPGLLVEIEADAILRPGALPAGADDGARSARRAGGAGV